MTILHSHAGDHPDHHYHGERTGVIGWQRSAWSSVLMAAATAIACQLVFTALGFAVGATAAEMSNARSPAAQNLGIGAGVWWLITGSISLLIGGLILGRMSGMARSTGLILSALALWAVTAVFGFFVVWSGMMSAVTSPLTALTAPAMDGGTFNQSSIAGSESAAGPGAGTGVANPSSEQLQEAARTASWWTVIGMLAGAGFAVGGAWLSAPKESVLVRG